MVKYKLYIPVYCDPLCDIESIKSSRPTRKRLFLNQTYSDTLTDTQLVTASMISTFLMHCVAVDVFTCDFD